ncbi:hypothetical protein PVAP13_7NG056789 [Panicum virgatum]|uniref:Uncharacterized protein n=1 Tax=Panicum virgatum TaxID=38727 RepID=A0A8T0PXA7_PANVG|nr:hypothetical protein PVAP13_7NG056789 [Panicum virgatum]
MSKAAESSKASGDENMSLLEDDLLDPEFVALQLESHRRTGVYLEDIIKRSRRKSELLQGYGDVVAHVECLETDLQN